MGSFSLSHERKGSLRKIREKPKNSSLSSLFLTHTHAQQKKTVKNVFGLCPARSFAKCESANDFHLYYYYYYCSHR